jgi:hypothetical protein
MPGEHHDKHPQMLIDGFDYILIGEHQAFEFEPFADRIISIYGKSGDRAGAGRASPASGS